MRPKWSELWEDFIATFFSEKEDVLSEGCPVGSIIVWQKGVEVPKGYVLCNGKRVWDFRSPYFLLKVPKLEGTTVPKKIIKSSFSMDILWIMKVR